MVRGPRLCCGCAAAGCRCLPARSLLAPLRGGVCDVGTILPRTVTSPPRTVTSQPANGGNCSIRGATRRRHAEARLLMVQNAHHCPWCHAPQLLQDCPARRWLNALARHLQSKAIQARGRAQIRTIKGSSGRVEVFQMDGVGISIIERPRPLHNHDTPNPAQHLLHPHMRRDPIGIVVASPASPRHRCVWIGGYDRPREDAADPRRRCVWTGVQGTSHWRCTRYVALHPLCGAAPEQKGCNAYGSGALPLRTSESVVGVCGGDCVARSGGLPRRLCVWIGGYDRPREGAADPRYCCVWTGVQGTSHWRCNRYVAVHPNRRGGPVRKPLAGRASGVPGTTWILPRAWCTRAGSKTATTGTT